MDSIIATIRKDLKKQGNKRTRETGQGFFKEQVKFHGVKNAVVKKISKDYFKKIRNKTKAEIFDLCEALWKSGFIEESFIACQWSYFLHKSNEPADFKVFEKWVNSYVSNWASCDTLCNHTIGGFIEMYPKYVSRLKIFANSKNRWMRRAAAVSLIIPAKKGKFLKDVLEIADILLEDNDDLVQKGYGWMLKAASQFHQRAIYDYIMKNKSKMPRTALRYAIEKMPKELKAGAMGKK